MSDRSNLWSDAVTVPALRPRLIIGWARWGHTRSQHAAETCEVLEGLGAGQGPVAPFLQVPVFVRLTLQAVGQLKHEQRRPSVTSTLLRLSPLHSASGPILPVGPIDTDMYIRHASFRDVEMTHVFMSYSRPDEKIALRIVEGLRHFYDIWIDREAIRGGTAWETAIDEALRDCSIFMVVVSPDSNDSPWVRRETIRAQQLGKPIIPLLGRGEVPLRLIDVQFIDFRGDYEGGFRDLLEALPTHLRLQLTGNIAEINRLIGAGIRAHLTGDYSKASSWIGQALAMDGDPASPLTSVWRLLIGDRDVAIWSNTLHGISTSESSRQIGAYPDGRTRYEWWIEIVADDAILDQVDYVRYELHETFARPLQIVRDRKSNFRLRSSGWGLFRIIIKLYFKDGTAGAMYHDLTLNSGM